MDWSWFLFRFDGRINRARMRLALLVVLCWMIFLAAIARLTGLAGEGSFGFSTGDLFSVLDPAAYQSLVAAGLPFLLYKAVATLLFLWVYLAASIKRLHDRDRSGWWMVPFFVLPGFYNQFDDRLPDSYFMMLPGLACLGLGIWGFVEIYCLRGSRKTNRFGADPLAPPDTRPRWEQASEIEMVPHKAGPPPV